MVPPEGSALFGGGSGGGSGGGLSGYRDKLGYVLAAALHDPDMIAGGKDRIARVGDTGVNSSIGGGWGDADKPGSRIAGIDRAARNAPPGAKMSVTLEPCRGRVGN